MGNEASVLRVINTAAPIRICDNGGWTDTWFAEYGNVFNIAVYPYAEVQMRVFRRQDVQSRITIHAENYGQRYVIEKPHGTYSKHPLLEAAFEYMHIPEDVAIEVSIFSEAPAGCSTGTSAAVSVALIGALDCLTPARMTPYELATAAHKIETELLKQQCGIQDQLASSFGGINFIEMTKYPQAIVHPITLPNSLWWELERRLSLIYVGHAHSSSAVHQKVIRELEGAGPEAPKLKPLRATAQMARSAMLEGDFAAFGQSMVLNTEAQRELHPDLIGPDHRAIIEIAKAHAAIGYKVNGAGGDGGSVTVLSDASATNKREMLQEVQRANPHYQQIPIYLSRFGLRVWESGNSQQTR